MSDKPKQVNEAVQEAYKYHYDALGIRNPEAAAILTLAEAVLIAGSKPQPKHISRDKTIPVDTDDLDLG